MFPYRDLEWIEVRRSEERHHAKLERMATEQAREERRLRSQSRRSTPLLVRLTGALRGA